MVTALLSINLVSGTEKNVVTEFLYEIALQSHDFNETLCGSQLLYWLEILAADQEMWALKSEFLKFLFFV